MQKHGSKSAKSSLFCDCLIRRSPLPQPHPGPTAVLINELDAGGLQGSADCGDGGSIGLSVGFDPGSGVVGGESLSLSY
jgi:hypothetical protein